MLQTIRERAQGLVAAVIIFFLCLTFAVWGVESYLTAAREVVVAEIDGEEVLLQEYQATLQRLRQRAQAELGEAFDPTAWDDEATKLQALEFLVENKVLGQNVDHARLKITTDQLASYLKSSPSFQVDGKFSAERYQQITSMLGFDEQSYEIQARRDLALQQLRAGIVGSAFVTPAEIAKVEQLRAQTRDIAFAVIPPTEPAQEVVSDEDARRHFESRKENYRVEDKVALEYIELKLGDLMARVAPTKEELTQYYESHKADFTVEEQRNANHILVQLEAGAAPEQDAAARKKAEEMRELVLGGREFEEVAKEFSDDIGSRSEGGATGLFGRGVMAPEFEEAVFSMKVGEISEPVKTSFGYHVIKVAEIKPGGVTSFDEARADVEARVRREQAEELFYESAERFGDTVYEHPDSLAESAAQLDLQVATTSEQTRDQIAAAFNPAVAEAVWEPEVLTQGLASPPIEIGDDRVVAVRVTKFTPSHLPEFETVRTQVVAEIQEERVRTAARTRGEALLERLRKGEAGAELAKGESLKWETFDDASRDDERVNRAVLRAAFRAPLGSPDAREFIGVEFGSGNYAVVEVSGPQSPAASSEATATAARARDALTRTRTFIAWEDFVDALKASSRIETFPDRL
ncbi:MAG: SurA N-terminal domain-containing protein [Gammaproteobacteria bacterium]